jgi:formylglycine-generating enzyme
VREVEVDAFRIDRCAVSNRRFSAFADATEYVTDAERYGLLAPTRGTALFD